LITLLGIGLSLTPAARLEKYGASRWGYLCLYLLLAAMGSKARLQYILQAPLLIVMAYVWVFIHALILGVYPALRITGFGQGDFVEQLHGTILPLWVRGDLGTTVGNWILVVGLISTLIFFFFSKEHKGAIGGTAKLGVYFLMVSFGASYGYTVMARISLLIGRVMFLLHDWLGILRF